MKTILLTVFLVMSAFPAMAKPLRVIALGDSLTAGYGLPKGSDYASQLQAALRKDDIDVMIENAGISGDTTEGGLARLANAIKGDKPDLVIVALGANDILRGVDPKVTEGNLRTILQTLKDQDIQAVLFGMQAPPFQTQPAYRQAFNKIYPNLADEFDVELYPFFLDGVFLNPALNLADGLHPNVNGIAVMVERTQSLIADSLD